MSNLEEIKTAIEALAPDELARLKQWVLERDWQQWDKQIEADSKAGKLDFLISEAMKEEAKRPGRGP